MLPVVSGIAGFLLRLLGGDLAQAAINGLVAAQRQRLQAQNDADRLQAEQNIAFWQGQVSWARDALGAATERQGIKLNHAVFWFILGVALLPGLGTFLLLAIYNVLWHAKGIWPQPWGIAAFPAPYGDWAQMSVEWVFDPVKLAATTATAAAGGYLTGRR